MVETVTAIFNHNRNSKMQCICERKEKKVWSIAVRMAPKRKLAYCHSDLKPIPSLPIEDQNRVNKEQEE